MVRLEGHAILWRESHNGTLTAANYTQTYAFDVLNRLTTGPRGSGYTYGDANHLDAVTSAPSYTAAYDAAGEQTCRSTSTSLTCAGSTLTGQPMGYDALNRLLTWQNQASSPTISTQDAYDGEGQRVWQEENSSGTVTTTEYFGGMEEISTKGTTTKTNEYLTAGPVLLVKTGSTLTYLVQDGEASVSEQLTSSGTVVVARIYKPYGGVLYQSSSSSETDHNYTGQILDGSGLLYYNARYYDSIVGQFTSGDFVQGPNRYGYVDGNPETLTDPTGKNWWDSVTSAVGNAWHTATSYLDQAAHNTITYGDAGPFAYNLGLSYAYLTVESTVNDIKNDPRTLADPHASWQDKFGAGVNLAFNLVSIPLMFTGAGEAADAGEAAVKVAPKLVDEGGSLLNKVGDVLKAECGNSFQGNTVVATATGGVAIGALKVGDTVTAYNPKTGKPEAKAVQHVFVNTDNNLLDVTIAPVSKSAIPSTDTKQQSADTKTNGAQGPPETLHTTTEHPFLTLDRGFVNAEDLQIGEQVQQLDGSVGVVVSLQHIFGIAVRYNLTVQDDHTYAVGADQWVVHNTCLPGQTGRYGTMIQQSIKDGLDLHHMPASNYIVSLGIKARDGFVVAMDTSMHSDTWTYGLRDLPQLIQNDGLTFRQVLARDLWNYHDLGGPNSGQVARDAQEFWQNFRPDLMQK